METIIIKNSEGIEKLKEILNSYSFGTAGGHIDDFADKQADTIEAIIYFLNGGDIRITVTTRPIYKVERIYKYL